MLDSHPSGWPDKSGNGLAGWMGSRLDQLDNSEGCLATNRFTAANPLRLRASHFVRNLDARDFDDHRIPCLNPGPLEQRDALGGRGGQ